jgi:cyclopropane-fatty-acyl-phospholipid synthase
MLYKFKSQAAAEVIMLQPDAETLLKIIGKSPGAQGIITVQQVPAAVAALRQAIAAQEAAGSKPADRREDEDEDEQNPGGGVPLRTRAGPFIDLLEQSAAAGKDVVWGV